MLAARMVARAAAARRGEARRGLARAGEAAARMQGRHVARGKAAQGGRVCNTWPARAAGRRREETEEEGA
jgi:hypothetical protein